MLSIRHKTIQQILIYYILIIKTFFIECEIRSFEGTLEATSEYIHYSEGYLIAPGYIDISGLTFSAAVAAGEESTAVNDNNNNNNRHLQKDPSIDIAVFYEPSDCPNNQCDWTELGIGATTSFGDVHWCCWGEDALSLELCQSSRSESHTPKGHLILNRTQFKGQSRSINIPTSSTSKQQVKFGKLKEGISGKYILVIANCNPTGRNMTVSGKYVLKSKHGFLPGNLFGAMYFFGFLSVSYLLLLLWYGIKMKFNQESMIPIQQWILATISISFLEAFFKAGDYWVWNEDGLRFWFAMYTGVLLGVLKRAIIRCLAITVSLGWGVIRDELSQMPKILILGISYAITSAICDVCQLLLNVVENRTVTAGTKLEEEHLFDVITVLTFVIAAIDVTFYMWILDALGGTMQYLENLNQHQKLLRYLRLRLVLLLSIVFAITWAVFGIVNTYLEGNILEPEQEWAVLQIWHLNYLMVLIGVAILWKPHANAKEYAFVMQLPTGGEDGIGNNTELEMVETAVIETDADVLKDVEEELSKDDHEEEADTSFALKPEDKAD